MHWPRHSHIFSKELSPDTGPVLRSLVGIRYVYVHVYCDEELSLTCSLEILAWCAGSSLKDGRPSKTTYSNVQRRVYARHKEEGTDGALCAYMLRFKVRRETVDPHVLKAQNPSHNVLKKKIRFHRCWVVYKAALRVASANLYGKKSLGHPYA